MFSWQNKSIFRYSYKVFSILAQTVLLKDNAKIEVQSVKTKTQNYEKSFKF